MNNEKKLYVAHWSDNDATMWGWGEVDMSKLDPHPPKLYFWAHNDKEAELIETRFNLVIKMLGRGIRCLWNNYDDFKAWATQQGYDTFSFTELVGTEVGLGEVPKKAN